MSRGFVKRVANLMVIFAFSTFFLTSTRSYAATCSQNEWNKSIGSHVVSEIFVSFSGSTHRVRIALHYSAEKNRMVGVYADAESAAPISLSGPMLVDGGTTLHNADSRMKFPVMHVVFSKGCSKLNGYIKLSKANTVKLNLIKNGEISSFNKSERMKDEMTATKLKVAAKNNTINAFVNLLSYPTTVCLFGEGQVLILNKAKDAEDSYEDIMTDAERTWIAQAVPFNLRTGLNGSVFARGTIQISHGKIDAMCIQTKDSLPIGFVCRDCP